MNRAQKLELISLLEEKERRQKLKALESLEWLKLSRVDANVFYDEKLEEYDSNVMRFLVLNDLFFLLSRICKRKDMDEDWIFANCREVQADPDGYIDLWFRDGYKSTTITFGLTIQDILKNPEETIGIHSHTRPIAKAFLTQIMQELENNQRLKDLFPDILYQNPQKEARKWSVDGGIRVKRKTNPKEETIEAWGLVDGQPTGKHFSIQVYDDVVTRESVTTPEQIKKVTGSWELSLNLGSKNVRRRYIGTRYHVNDTYRTIMDRGSASPRIKPATKDGKWPGESVFLPQAVLDEKRRDMGPYTFGTQMLQDPVADKAMSFKEQWLKHYRKISYDGWNLYLLVDPASKKKKTSDYTVMLVIGLAPDNNYYLVDGIRDRLSLTQRAAKVFEFHRKYPLQNVGYEEYGSQADIEHLQYEMERQNYRFNITPLKGNVAKEDRIQKLIPIFEQLRFWIPEMLTFVDYEGRMVDLIKKFREDEFLAFPVCVHDDMLDCMARILDPALGVEFPKKIEPVTYNNEYSGVWTG